MGLSTPLLKKMWPLLEYVRDSAGVQNLAGNRTRLLIQWRKGKREHISFSGGIFELCNGAKKIFLPYGSCF